VKLLTSLIACMFTAVTPAASRADEVNTLKTEYYEAATNFAPSVNHKQWTTFRNGKAILTRTEDDIARNGVFDSISTIISHEGQKILHLSSGLGKLLCSFEPQSKYQVLLVDADSNGVFERIVVSDAKGKLLDTFTVAPDGRVTPIPDAELRHNQDLLESGRKAFEKFNK
jgi:hypothetical protein